MIVDISQRFRFFWIFGRRHPKIVIGLFVLSIPIWLWVVGSFFVGPDLAQALSAPIKQPPSLQYPFGTDTQGRNLFAVVVHGAPLTMRIGMIGGSIGVGIGVLLGFTSGYLGGVVDAVIRTITDSMITIPGLAIMIVVAASVKGVLTVDQMGLLIAALSWPGPTRVIRSQVLPMKSRGFVDVCKLSGLSSMGIMFGELVPNLAPFLAASFITSVIAAIFAAVGLQVIGLGPQAAPTMGMTIYWSEQGSALLSGLWWWWVPPMAVIVDIFLGLYIAASGFDEIANPRIRGA